MRRCVCIGCTCHLLSPCFNVNALLQNTPWLTAPAPVLLCRLAATACLLPTQQLLAVDAELPPTLQPPLSNDLSTVGCDHPAAAARHAPGRLAMLCAPGRALHSCRRSLATTSHNTSVRGSRLRSPFQEAVLALALLYAGLVGALDALQHWRSRRRIAHGHQGSARGGGDAAAGAGAAVAAGAGCRNVMQL